MISPDHDFAPKMTTPPLNSELQNAAAESGSSRTLSGKAWLPYLLLALILIFFALIRIRLLNIPLERDEGEYAYIGQLLLQGISPYKFAYSMKLPGTAAMYAASFALFGQSPAAIHAGLLLASLVTMLLVFFLAKEFFGAYAGVVAAATYGVLSASPSVLGFAGHATHFVVLFACGGILVLLRALRSQRLFAYFFSGFLLGLAFLMKQPAIFFLFFAAVYLLRVQLRSRTRWKQMAVRISLLLVGGLLPFAITCLLVWRSGTFPQFWFWTFTYAQQYGGIVLLKNAPLVFYPAARSVMRPAVSLWIFAAIGLTAFFWRKECRDYVFFAFAFLLFSFLGVCPGYYFRPHYFILLLPAISFLVAAAVIISEKLLRPHRFLRFLPALAFICAFSCAIVRQRQFLFAFDPITACRFEYDLNPFPEAPAIAQFLQSHSSPTDTIAVLGAEPEIFFYAHRNSATGFIYSYPLLEEQPYALPMQQKMISEIEAARPEFIVLVPISWGRMHPQAPTLALDWARNYLLENYTPAKSFNVPADSSQWDAAPAAAHFTRPYAIQIFQRK